jgi:LysM domain
MSTVAMHPGLTRAAAVRRAPRATAVRLTRRGRLAVVLLLMGLILVLLAVFGPHSAATGEVGTPVQTRTVEVGPGDTLWTIASDVAGPGQVRDMVHRIEELNALNGPAVAVGQEIAVPVG